MNKPKFEIIENLISIFDKAPKGFCNFDNEELTHEDIKLRQFSAPIGIPNIANREIIFRKFYELRNLSCEKQVAEIQNVMIFLLKHGLNPGDIGRILDELVFEINAYNKFSRRIVFNPFS